MNEIAKLIVNAAYRVHVELGQGVLESAYETCLIYELISAGLQVENQIELPVYYKDLKINCNYRIDINFNEAKIKDGIKRVINHYL